MLAHAASAQGISAVENIVGRPHVVDHDGIPAACFTHPEIAFVGLTEEKALEKAKAEGFELGKSVSYFKANSKALAEGEGDGIAKVLFNKKTEQIVGVHIIGMHAADLIQVLGRRTPPEPVIHTQSHFTFLSSRSLCQECANAYAAKSSVRDLAYMVSGTNFFSQCLAFDLVDWPYRLHQIHTHPTLSEVLDAAFKGAVGMAAH